MVRAEPGANLWLALPGTGSRHPGRDDRVGCRDDGLAAGTTDRDAGHAVSVLLAPALRRGSVERTLGVGWRWGLGWEECLEAAAVFSAVVKGTSGL